MFEFILTITNNISLKQFTISDHGLRGRGAEGRSSFSPKGCPFSSVFCLPC